jgi:molybdenum-dependent DNA-binding transcriptional regulator ModE
VPDNKKQIRVAESRDDFLTIREIELLESLKRFKLLREAANNIGLKYPRAERILGNIRRKWRMSVNTNNRILGLTKRDADLRRLLYTPVRRAPVIEEPEEEESYESQLEELESEELESEESE